MSYILEIEEDQNGDQYVTFPEDILEELGWLEGDLLEWNMNCLLYTSPSPRD